MTKSELIDAAKKHPAINADFNDDEIDERITRYMKSIDFTATEKPESEIDHIIDNTSIFNV